MQRIEQAKEARSIYWHVPVKDKTTSPGTHTTRVTARQEDVTPAVPIPSRPVTTEGPDEPTRHTEPPSSTLPTEVAPQQAQTPEEIQAPFEATTVQSPAALSVVEVGGPPATQPEDAQEPDLVIDPRLITEEPSPPVQIAEDSPLQPYLYPEEGLEGVAIDEADSWLGNLANDNANEWLRNIEGDEPSPPTSMATDTRTAGGRLFKGCRCPSYQDIYNDWPTQDAELRIAKCMRVCVYCGKDFENAAVMRGHMKRIYARKNITISPNPRGR